MRTSIGGSSDFGTYTGAPSTPFTFMGLIYVVSTQVIQSASPYQNTCIYSGDARLGIFLSTSGLGYFHYTGSWPNHSEAMSTGAWHFFCVRSDGTTVQIDIDNVAGTPTVFAASVVGSGLPAYEAKNSYTNVTSEYALRERVTLTSRITDADRDKYYSYLKATYPAAGLP